MSPNYFRNANKRYRAPLPGHDLSASLRFAFLVYPPSLRATTTIYIVTGGAVLYSPFTSPGQISDGRNFTGEYPHAKYSRAERGGAARSRARASGRDDLQNCFAVRTVILEKCTRPVRYRWSPTCVTRPAPGGGRGRLFTYEDGGGGGRRRQALMPMHHAYSKLRRGTAVRGS